MGSCRNPFWSQVRSGCGRAREAGRRSNVVIPSGVRSGQANSSVTIPTYVGSAVVIPSGVRSGQAYLSQKKNEDNNAIVVIPSGVRSGQASLSEVCEGTLF